MKNMDILSCIVQLSALIAGKKPIRERKPRNPRTKNQMAQRIQISNVVATYQLLSSFLKDFRQTKSKKLNVYNLFIKDNLGKVKVYLDKNEVQNKACVAAPYLISQGTLSSIEMEMSGNVLISSVRVPERFRITETTTLGEVSDALLTANRDFCDGDQLTIVHLIQKHTNQNGIMIPHADCRLYTFTLAPRSKVIFGDLIPLSLFRVAHEGFIGTDENVETGGIAYVQSRKIGSKIYVSTQSIVLTPDNITYKKYSSEEKKKQAAESYRTSSEPVFLDPEKLTES